MRLNNVTGLFVFAIIAFLVPVMGCGAIDTESSLGESQAQAINRSLMCPVCPSETIDQAQVELAAQMRDIVADMLSEGATREEILQFFVDRYGESVLAEPSKRGFNLLIWVVPPAALLSGFLLLYAVILRIHRPDRGNFTDLAADEPTSPADLLEPLLERVDREMSSLDEASSSAVGEQGKG